VVKRELINTTAFVRAAKRYLKLNPQVSADLRTSLNLLSAEAHDPRLKTHKLKGNLSGVWACSAGRDLRILFEFVDRGGKEAILLLSMGSHDEVY
jgi:addiction module RelE/StbE family toxin